MSNIPIEVLNSASGTLSLLTKARCVKSYSFSEDKRYKILRPWPPSTLSTKEALDWLEEKNITFDTVTRVKSYEVSHSFYKQKERIPVESLDQLEFCRDLLVSLIISKLPEQNIEIKALWDKAKNPQRTYPTSTSDIDRIREFSCYNDSMLGFYHPSIEHKYKIPAYAGEALFQAMGLFSETTITPADRSQATGIKTDKSGISKRFVVHQGNKKFLEEVMRSTINSVSKITEDLAFTQKFKESREQFRHKK